MISRSRAAIGPRGSRVRTTRTSRRPTSSPYDNGNTRCAAAADPSQCHSRGQVYELDEVNRIARLVVNAGLGAFSPALGSAQALANGNFSFASGYLQGPSGTPAKIDEVTPGGASVYAIVSDSFVYRSHRLFNLH